ncbi:unnamed protein product [Rodentolepis nana]|uniref:Uncharacterized protein n=1 Tax=Rodentolepis nana TaxID=102285 RepID=A0A0R3TCW5_RODNA|nr:unnamed protein product [Rodentolepis nana]
MSEKSKTSDTSNEANFPILPESSEPIPLTGSKDSQRPKDKRSEMKPLSIDVDNIEAWFGSSPESVSTLVGSLTPQGFSPDHQEQGESETTKKLEETKIDPEKTPQKPKSPTK